MSTAPSGPVRLLIVGGAVAALVYLAAPYFHAPAAGNLTDPNSYDEYGWRGDPLRRDRAANQGQGPRGYSDFYPGPRPERPAGSPVARQQLHLDPDRVDDVEDRRSERRSGLDRLGPTWDQARGDATGGLRCRDVQTGRDVPLSFCERGR
jgi:hypothetical protein